MRRLQCLSALALTGLLSVWSLGCATGTTDTADDDADLSGEEMSGEVKQGLDVVGDRIFDMGWGYDGRLGVYGRGLDNDIFGMWELTPSGAYGGLGGYQQRSVWGRGPAIGAGGWGSWTSLGGSLISTPRFGYYGDGMSALYGVGVDNAIWYNRQLNTGAGCTTGSCGWSGWTSIGGACHSAPVVTQCASNYGRCQSVVSCRGADNAVWQTSLGLDGAWSPWGSLGGAIAGAPVVTAGIGGGFDVYGRGLDNALWYTSQSAYNNVWSPWASLGGTLAGSPVVVTNPIGRTEIYGRGLDGALWFTGRLGYNNLWSPWSSLGGNFIGDPYLTSAADGRFYAFGLGVDNALWSTRQLSGSLWSPWDSLGGDLTSAPYAYGSGSGLINVFARGPNAGLWSIGQTGIYGNNWGAWNSLGGVLY